MKQKKPIADPMPQHERFKLAAAASNCISSPNAFDERLRQMLGDLPANGPPVHPSKDSSNRLSSLPRKKLPRGPIKPDLETPAENSDRLAR